MVLFLQLVIWFGWIAPALRHFGIAPVLQSLDATLLAVCTLLITAAGYVINDIYDVGVDAVNKPEKRIVNKEISLDSAIHFYYALVVVGALIAAFLAWRIGHFLYFLIYVLFSIKLWFYSHSLQKRPLTGNLLVAMLSAIFPLFYLLAEEPALRQLGRQYPDEMFRVIGVLLVFSGFAFLVSWSRELIKDIEDIAGDKVAGFLTLPIVAGVEKTVRFVVVLMALTALLVLLWGGVVGTYWSIGMGVVIFILLGATGYKSMKCSEKACFHTISLYLKGIMLLGMVFLCLHILMYGYVLK